MPPSGIVEPGGGPPATTLRGMPNRRRFRAFYAIVATLLGVVFVVELRLLWDVLREQNALGADLAFFRDISRHWQETGEFYVQRQLTGPYLVETLVDVLYPPVALYWFVPFLWLPPLLWWAIPITVLCVCIARMRPAAWAWPLIMIGVAWPQTVSQLLYGNTNMWIAAFVAAGLTFGWPSVLILAKPSLAPFALIGIRRPRWWVALGAMVLASIPFGCLWLDYATAMRNSSLDASHALVTLPLMLSPVWAWLARRDPATEQRSPSLP